MERVLVLRLTLLSAMVFAFLATPGHADDPAYWTFAPTPPMGWNSYDAWGTSITEDETLANAQYMEDHLLSTAGSTSSLMPDGTTRFHRMMTGTLIRSAPERASRRMNSGA